LLQTKEKITRAAIAIWFLALSAQQYRLRVADAIRPSQRPRLSLQPATCCSLSSRAELNLLLAVFDRQGYRSGLAEKLRRRGLGIVARERRPNNPYKYKASRLNMRKRWSPHDVE
jgi:hypothetical protein